MTLTMSETALQKVANKAELVVIELAVMTTTLAESVFLRSLAKSLTSMDHRPTRHLNAVY